MAVLFPGKFVFLATPHTASSATVKTLTTLEGSVLTRKHHETRKELIAEHGDVLQGNEVFVTVVRNPYDLAVTWWFRQRKYFSGRLNIPEPDFAKFIILLDTFTPQPYIREGRIFWHEPDEVLRYETLQQDLDVFLARFGMGPLPLKQDNITVDKGNWRDHYKNSRRAKNLIDQRYGDEINAFGYSFETPEGPPPSESPAG